jgi:sugar lactone lactonase YvrE
MSFSTRSLEKKRPVVKIAASKLENILVVMLVLASLGLTNWSTPDVHAADNSQYFPQTKHTVAGKFLDYWNANGGLPVFGYPISEAQNEVDPETGKTFLTQWFERNRFELHPELAGTKYEVELGLLGKDLRRQALAVDPDFAKAAVLYDASLPKEQQWYFQETGHNLRLGFLTYWLQHGGLDRFGYPISEEHQEVDPETGNVYVMQWFERARFEYHPENAAPYDILLGLLGNQIKAPKSSSKFVWKIGGNPIGIENPHAMTIDSAGNVYLLDAINNQVGKFDKNGKFLTKWGIAGYSDGQLNNPNGITIDSAGNLYIADTANNRIQKFDKNGKFLTKWGKSGVGDGLLNNPKGIAVDTAGNLYIADTANNRIQKFDKNGKFLTKWGTYGDGDGQFRSPSAIAIDTTGNLYVLDADTLGAAFSYDGWVKKFDSNGKFLTKWDVGYSAKGITVDNTNNVYIISTTDYLIQKFDSNGKLLSRGGIYGSADGQFVEPVGVAVDSSANLYVIDINYNLNQRVEKFDSSGNFLSKWLTYGDSDGQFEYPTGIAIDSKGFLYVTETGINQNQRVEKFDSSGNFLFKWLTYGYSNAQFEYPNGIAIDNAGNVYVADLLSPYIKKFDNNGKFLSKWSISHSDYYNITGIAVDKQGFVYIAKITTIHPSPSQSTQVEIFDSSGKSLASWDSQARNAAKLAVDNQGDVYVVDTASNVIRKFDSSGKLLKQWGGDGYADGQFNYPSGIATDRQGNVYVADAGNYRIEKFDSNGNFITKWGRKGSGDAQFDNPVDLAIDGSANVYVIDYSNHQLQKFQQP